PITSPATVSPIALITATIARTTNQPADSQVEYGLRIAYGTLTALDSGLVTAHVRTLTGLSAGTLYHYRVRSQDAAGNLSVSANSTFTTLAADTTAPAVSIASPAASATVSGTITISATASDNVGVVGVQYKLDGINLGAEQTITPYAVSWDTTAATNAAHTLTAVARDAAGNAATSAPVTITVSNLPSVSVSPTSIAFDSVTVGTTSAAHNVQVTNTGSVGASLSSVTSIGPFAISQNYCVANGSWNGVMAPGTHCDVFVAFAPVVGGNATGTLSLSAAAVVYPITLAGKGVAPADTTPPTVSIASPGNGATVSGTIPVSASAADNVSVVGVQFKLDGTNLGLEETSSTYSIAWDTTTVSNGSHALTAV